MNEEWVGALPSLQDHNIELSSHCLASKNIFTMNDAADFEKKKRLTLPSTATCTSSLSLVAFHPFPPTALLARLIRPLLSS